MLDTGKIDTIAQQVSVTPERKEKYDFTDTYVYSSYSFVIKKDSNIDSLDKIKGKKVGAGLGGNGEKSLKKLNKEKGLNLNIVTYDGTPMEKDVELGRIDAAWIGTVKAKVVIDKEKLDLKQFNPKYILEENQYPFKKEESNKEKITKINKAIKEMQEDGTLKNLSEKWFKMDISHKE